jgi:hypothetical protein
MEFPGKGLPKAFSEDHKAIKMLKLSSLFRRGEKNWKRADSSIEIYAHRVPIRWHPNPQIGTWDSYWRAGTGKVWATWKALDLIAKAVVGTP